MYNLKLYNFQKKKNTRKPLFFTFAYVRFLEYYTRSTTPTGIFDKFDFKTIKNYSFKDNFKKITQFAIRIIYLQNV